MVKAVSFDLWFTLIYEDVADERLYNLRRVNALHRVLSRYADVSVEDVAGVFEVFGSVRGFVDHRSLVNMIALALGIHLDQEGLDLLQGVYDESTKDFRPRVNDEIYEVLPRVRASGLKVAVISNTSFSEGGMRAILDNVGVSKYVDVVVSSSSVGFNKPHPGIYTRMLSELGLRPEEVLHVGDSCINDVLGALNAGLKAALYVGLRRGKDSNVCLKLGVPVLSRLSDLIETGLIVS
ncbi:MAG: HAD family hydrolase [Zestosphaera sp.]